MPSEQAEAGHVGSLISLPAGCLKTFGISGNGAIEIDDGGSVIKWCPKRYHHGGDNAAAWFPEGFGNVASASGEPPKEHGFEKYPARKRKDFGSYRSRIEYLRSEAVHDGYELSRDSEMDFQQFVLSTSGLRRGSLVLMDNGNIRAVWKDGQGSRLGLQFLGGGVTQYVIFRRRGGEQQISRVAGRDSLDGVLRQIDAFDLGTLLYE